MLWLSGFRANLILVLQSEVESKIEKENWIGLIIIEWVVNNFKLIASFIWMMIAVTWHNLETTNIFHYAKIAESTAHLFNRPILFLLRQFLMICPSVKAVAQQEFRASRKFQKILPNLNKMQF